MPSCGLRLRWTATLGFLEQNNANSQYNSKSTCQIKQLQAFTQSIEANWSDYRSTYRAPLKRLSESTTLMLLIRFLMTQSNTGAVHAYVRSFSRISCDSGVISHFLGFSEVNIPSGGSDLAVLSWSFCSASGTSPSFSVCTFEWLLPSAACSSGTPEITQK